MISLDNILSGAGRVGICGHVKPDGDAYGSCMALYLFIRQYYPQIDACVFLEDNYSKTFEFIARSDEIEHNYPVQEAHDVFFALDCADIKRLGSSLDYFQRAKMTVVIDHHISNPGFGMINEVEADASSTAEMIALLIGKDRITKEIAEPLYMGITHDTGIFRYSCTSSRTMAVAGWLMETGIDFPWICDETFIRKSYNQTQIMGKALIDSVRLLDGQVIYAVISRKDMNEYKVSPSDMDGIVQQLRVTRGVETALFLYETEPGEYKVSMRSNGKVDVSKVAVVFKGGGHVMAAGCLMKGKIRDVIRLLADEIALQL